MPLPGLDTGGGGFASSSSAQSSSNAELNSRHVFNFGDNKTSDVLTYSIIAGAIVLSAIILRR